jgi:hypothetical protein
LPAPTACQHCAAPLPPRTGASGGRPPEYCGSPCRQAAYRKRRKAEPPAKDAGDDADAVVRDMAEDVVEEARHLLRILTRPDAPLLDRVEQAVSLSRSVENLTAGLVGRARIGRVPWAALGPALAMRPDTARRTYRAEAVSRRVPHASHHALPAPGPATVTVTAAVTAAVTASADSAGRPRSHLAPVLSRLHRASQLPLRALAARLGISPSHTSRILSGEWFPGWWLTERFAQACGADPRVLRKVWEDEKLRADRAVGSGDAPLDDGPAEHLPAQTAAAEPLPGPPAVADSFPCAESAALPCGDRLAQLFEIFGPVLATAPRAD